MSLNSSGRGLRLLYRPADAFLFAQINNGNALSLPFAKASAGAPN